MTDKSPEASVGLHWTAGHPILNMGIAGLTVFAGRSRPEDLTRQDLHDFLAWAKTAYLTKEMTSWMSVSFTINLLNPSYTDERKREELEDILTSFEKPNMLEEVRCSFFQLPAQRYAPRELVPMLPGQKATNFFPDGRTGLPVSGLAITALQGLSLASPIVGGRMVIVDCDEPGLLLDIVRNWQAEIRRRVQLSQASGEKQGIWGSPRTRLIETLLELSREVDRDVQGSVTLYHASNSGQGPDLSIYPLHAPVLSFLRKARAVMHSDVWTSLERRHWYREFRKDQDPNLATRNTLYEALYDLPLEAPTFIRRFFRSAVFAPFNAPKAEPVKGKRGKALETAPPPYVPLWNLLALFLKEVVAMERQRIEAIRSLGDRLAQLVQGDNDRTLFRKVYEYRRPAQVRGLLLQVSRDLLKNSEKPFGMDDYLNIFEEGEELTRADFGLAWDLTRMRFMEQLYALKWFDSNKAALEEVKAPDEEDSE